MSHSTAMYRKIGWASLIMMASVFLSRVIGLLREMVIAYVAGAGAAVDAYQIAFVIPEILNHVVASGFLSVTFIPIFSRYLAQDREHEGWRVLDIVLSCFSGVLVSGIAAALLWAPQLLTLVAPGLDNPLTQHSALRMTRIIIPAQFCFFIGGLFMAVQFAKNRFLIPALAPLIYNAGIIGGGLLLGPRLGMEGFAWGVLVGALGGNLILQYWGARRVGYRPGWRFNWRHPDLIQYIRLTLPLMVGLTMTFSTELFFKLFGSFLPDGSIAALNYALRVMLILVGLFGQAVGVASFPFMARLVAEHKLPEMNRLMNRTLRFLAMVIPFSVLMMVLRHEIVRVVFQRGQFDADATSLTAHVLVFLLLGAFAFAAQTVVVRGYYATQNTLFPAVYGSVAVLLSLPLYYLGLLVLGAGGVALAVALSAMLQVLLLYSLWNRRTGNLESRAVYVTMGKMALLGLVLGVVLEAFRRSVLADIASSSLTGSMGVAGLVTALFVVLMAVAGPLLKVDEITELARQIWHKVRRRRDFSV